MKNRYSYLRGFLLLIGSILILCSGMVQNVLAADGNAPITVNNGNYTFTKVSNPGTGSGKPDGINTNDVTGFPANRLNSYAWAVETLGDSIYIGTNRTLFGSALNAIAEVIIQADPTTRMTKEVLQKAVTLVTLGDVPTELEDTEYIPQIIRFDVKKGTTEVIYQPGTKRGIDGVLYYTDMDGNIIPNADVESETASFRSVVKFEDHLYFGSLGTNMLQLVRVDENNNAQIVFQTLGLISSLRAGCVYDAGNGETVYYGGQDTTYGKWRRMYGNQTTRPMPIVIRYLDPDTAGTDSEDWSGLVADFEDFGKYAYAKVYTNGGGTVWDLCSFNGYLYLILAYDEGWVLFRGEKGGDQPNGFGWTWTEIVGSGPGAKYPPAMSEEVSRLNAQYEAEFGCTQYEPSLYTAGLLESTATPFVYKGKMYIGTFDNATSIQSETALKALVKLKYLMVGLRGPRLSQIFGPIYEVLAHPQHLWVMDENENITPVPGANALLEGTTNDYVWRFIEHGNKLYMGTFDSSSAFNYYLGFTFDRILNWLDSFNVEISAEFRAMLDGSILVEINSALEMGPKDASFDETEEEQAFTDAVEQALGTLEKFYQNDYAIEDILDDMTRLQEAMDALDASAEGKAPDPDASRRPLRDLIQRLLDFFDIDGLKYWIKARALVRNDHKGFDLLVSDESGQKWQRIVDNGLNDIYNYGARTFTVLNGDLYLGTANPYFGGQLWKVSVNTPPRPPHHDPGFELFPLCIDCLLPNTGFSSRQFTNLSVKPDGLVYKDLGMVLQIPSLSVETDLVEIPFAEDTWSVEWLGDDAGLLGGSFLPGKGYSVIAAHNTLNNTEYGPFAKLAAMQKADLIFVTDRSGKITRFSVYANELLSPKGFGEIASIADGEPDSLILMTCENESVDGGYLNRRAIFAKPF